MLEAEAGKTWSKLSLIAGHARRDRGLQFTSLMRLLNVEYLRDCYKSLNRNKAVGIDGVSWEEYGVKERPMPRPRIVHNFYTSSPVAVS